MTVLTATKDRVVSINYTLRDEQNEVIDSSEGGEPLLYLHGHGQIIPGLEGKLEGRKIGEKLSVEVDPGDGYGEYDDSMVAVLPRDKFPKKTQIEVGAMFELSNQQGEPIVVRVTAADERSVTVDANHPLAGKKLFFEVEVVAIRAATESELEHGHAHSGDGHHHH